ncbi:unnamed protein product [Heligmosomoides polygyrus]|uniref:Transposase n=1 Tax=Heligmosomoides polygyrus TaxID=6339 RepID=A0A183G2I6_HELPZ|nr:unnamed protein product [Heligmosomoides polygyrus]
MDTKMLRWTAGVTRLDRVRKDAIRQRFGVAPIAEKLREARLRWYGHVLRANDDTVRKTGLNLEVPGMRPRGRPKQRTVADVFGTSTARHARSPTCSVRLRLAMHGCRRVRHVYGSPSIVADVFGTSTARHARSPTC